LFNEDGEGPIELLKGEKINQTLLKFVVLCSFSIHNLIVLLKHHLGNSSFIGCIFKLKVLSSSKYVQDNCFLGQRVGKKNYLFKMFVDGAGSKFDLV
jgi:hypothetical protein